MNDVILSERVIQISDGKELHITRKQYEGKDGIDIRFHVKFRQFKDNVFYMTKNGIFISIETAKMLRDQLNEYLK